MEELSNKNKANKFWVRSTHECAYFAVFLALVFASQFALSFVAGIEIVSLLFITYAYVFGIRRSVFASTAFSLLRNIFYGFYPQVLILYLIYYNVLSCVFGALGKRDYKLIFIIIISIVCTIFFTLLDDVITPLYFSFTLQAAKAYFLASLVTMAIQCVCVGATVAVLFKPIKKVFRIAKKSLILYDESGLITKNHSTPD